MKYLFILFAILFTVTFTACDFKLKSNGKKETIDISKVDFIEIRKNYNVSDSSQLGPKRLTLEQSKNVVKSWNKAESVGLCKYYPNYWLEIHIKGDSTRNFRVNGSNFKEKNDECFDIGNNKFFNNLWKELDNSPLHNIQIVFDNYVKQHESTDTQANKDLMIKSIETLDKMTDPNELELLINVWLYYDPTDFPCRNLVFKVLEKSKPESIKAIKTRIERKNEWETDDKAPYSELSDLIIQISK